MILGIGSDIVSIKRIEKILFKHQRFPQKILSDRELLYFYEKNQSSEFLAGRFAGKEAFMKALGTGWGKGITFKDIEIIYKEKRPFVVLKDNALKFFNEIKGKKILITITHEKDYAISFVVIEG